MGVDPLVALAVVASAAAAATLAGILVRPPRRLAARLRPYTVAARTSLGRSADVRAVADPGPIMGGGTLRRLFGPLLLALAQRFGRYLDSSSEESLRRKLRQADLLREVPEQRRAQEYRIRQVGTALGACAGGILTGAVLALGAPTVLVLGLAGFVAGAARWRARIDHAIEARRERMRIELYTVNQLIALHIRVGGGVVQAVRRVVERGNGEVVDELADILRAHESGVSARDAFARASDETPEPHVARTYRLLATGAELGADLAEALLAHSEDVRESRREALRRTATRRRAAMLLPIIGVLAPVMLLFIAAPLPSIVFAGT